MNRKYIVAILFITITILSADFSAHALKPCGLTVYPDQLTFDAAGGNGKVKIKTLSTYCPYTISVEGQWIRITKIKTGRHGMLDFAVDAYQGEIRRIGTIRVNGKAVMIIQPGSSTPA